MLLQAYIDDSYKPDGSFVLAGYIASVAAWSDFSREWEEMLPHGVRANNGQFHFKMAEMAWLPERLDRVSWFYRIIERHVLAAVSCAINLNELEKAKKRIWIQHREIHWDSFTPYMFTCRCLLDMFHNNRKSIEAFIPLDEKVDFYFDEQIEKKDIIGAWGDYIQNRPDNVRPYYGVAPRFEDDKAFLPLQAADFWAWWVRKWHEEGRVAEGVKELSFMHWQVMRKYFPRIHIEFDEDQIVEALTELIASQLKPGDLLCRIRFSYKNC